MRSRKLMGCVSGVGLLLLCGPFVAAAADPPDQAAVDRLEALIEAQQAKIESLEQQVAAAQQADVSAARVEELKKQIREVLSEQEFRESLMPSTLQAGYDKGFFIKSSDNKFKLQFNGQLQFRYTYYNTQTRNHYLLPSRDRSDRSGFDIARMNFDFSGHVYTPDLTYFIELGANSASSYDTILNYAWVNYRIVDEFQFRAGLFKTANLRANIVSNAQYQMVESGLVDAVFGLDDGVGVRMWGQLFDKKLDYYLDVVNSLDNPTTQTITTDEDLYTRGHDNNPGILARVVWHALCGQCRTLKADDPARWDTMSDMEYSMEPSLDVGFSYAFNEDWHDGTLRIPYARRTFFLPGGFGLESSEGTQINQFGLDAAFKYRGFSITGEYVVRIVDIRNADGPPYSPLFLASGDGSTTGHQGAYVQAGYFLPIPGWEDKFEVVGRVGGISTLTGGSEGTWEYAGGLNYYIKGHSVKLQTDVVKITELPISNSTFSYANVNDDALMWRMQLQVAF